MKSDVYFLDFVAFLYLLRSHNRGAFEKHNKVINIILKIK